jgi:V8-like Glu-specific endopeptidase
MRPLTNPERVQLHQALVHAFPSWDDLDLATTLYLGEPLATITAPAAMPIVVMKLIQWGQARGLLGRVIEAAREARPDNPELAAFAGAMVSATPAPLSVPAVAATVAPLVQQVEFTDIQELRARAPQPGGATPAATVAREVLERKQLESLRFFGTAEWRQRMAAREAAVCRIEFPVQEGQGTGFLIGPDLVMTNHHVLVSFIDDGWDATQICCRFDYQASADGTKKNAGRSVALADDWLVRSSPTAELDYAIVRLAEPIGSQPAEGGRRGWLTPVPAHPLTEGESIFIVQHPKAAPLKVASGGLVKVEQRRVYYLANTLNGSSGSPCFTADWDLVALHRAGDEVSNVGVPIKAILDDVPDADRASVFVAGGI